MRSNKKLLLTMAGVSAMLSVPMYAKDASKELVILDNVLSKFNCNFEGGPSEGQIHWWSDANWSQNNVARVKYNGSEAPNEDCGMYYALLAPKDGSAPIAHICSADITGMIAAGDEYTYTFYAKLADGVAEGNVDLVIKGVKSDWSSSVETKGIPQEAVTLTNKWQKITGTFVLEDTKDQVLVQFEGNAGSAVCVDDFRVCRSADAGTLDIERDIIPVKKTMTSGKALGKKAIVGTEINSAEYIDELYFDLTAKHFNAVTLGNELKPDCMNGYHMGNASPVGIEEVEFNGNLMKVPVLDHSRADAILDKIVRHNASDKKNQLKVRGHVLVWHSQTPEWWFHENYDKEQPYVSKEVMDQRLEWYIKTMMDYYTNPKTETGKKYGPLFYGWDVVNEACTDKGLRTDVEGGSDKLSDNTHGNKSSWYHIYQSNEFIINAFRYANKYAPKTLELYYNDYGECNPKKRDVIVKLLKDIKAADGTRIDAMGMQSHHDMISPTVNQIEQAVRAYCAVVGKVQLTEMDIKGVKDDLELAYRYKDIYDRLLSLNKEKGITVSGITFWGTMDKYSWLQSSSSVGGGADGTQRQKPLLFNDNYKAKNAYYVFADQKNLPAKVAKEEIKKTPIEAARGNAVIDGEEDASWKNAKGYDLKVVGGTTKASGNVKVMWDNEALYVYFTVKDSVLNAESATIHEQDSVEVFIDENNHKTDEYEADDKQYRINFNNVQSFNGSKCTADNVESAVKLTSDGYIVEAKFLWTDIAPATDMEIGVDFQVNDADASTKRIGTVNLFDSTGNGWQWPSVYGSVFLK